jgi:hypothetical protein
MTSTEDRQELSNAERSRRFLDFAEIALDSYEQTDWHLELEATEDIELILGTLNDVGPYGYTISPVMEGDHLRAHLCNTREEIRKAYDAVHSRRNLVSWRPGTVIAGSWYTFVAAWWHVLEKVDNSTHDVEALLLFPSMGKKGITGEMVWPRLQPPTELVGPERRFDLLHADDTWFELLKAGDVDGALEFVAPHCQAIVRNYTDPTPEATHVELDGIGDVRKHLQAFADKYTVEAIDIVQRHIDDWYLFDETRWTVQSKEDGTRWQWLQADFSDYGNTDTKMNCRLGHGIYALEL